jgi:cell division protein FtsB
MTHPIKLNFILVILFSLFQLKLWFGEASIFELKEINRKVNLQNIKNEKLASRNQKLEREINLIKIKNPNQIEGSLIEDYARWKLGMVKPGEVFYYW